MFRVEDREIFNKGKETVYVCKTWFLGHFLLEHLNTGIQLIKAKLRDFEVSREKFEDLNKIIC